MSDQSLTIRVGRSTHELLRSMAASSNTSIMAVVDQAVRDLHRKKFWEDFNTQCLALQADSSAWADLQRDDEAWDETIADGLAKG